MTTNIWPQVRPRVMCRGVLYADIPNINWKAMISYTTALLPCLNMLQHNNCTRVSWLKTVTTMKHSSPINSNKTRPLISYWKYVIVAYFIAISNEILQIKQGCSHAILISQTQHERSLQYNNTWNGAFWTLKFNHSTEKPIIFLLKE
jgi:hypothetical protein